MYHYRQYRPCIYLGSDRNENLRYCTPPMVTCACVYTHPPPVMFPFGFLCPLQPSLFSAWPLISLICSAHPLILSPCSTTACHFVLGGCIAQRGDTMRRASTLPCYLISFFLYAPDHLEPSSSRGKRNAQTKKTTSLNAENRSYSFERSGFTHHIYLEEAN